MVRTGPRLPNNERSASNLRTIGQLLLYSGPETEYTLTSARQVLKRDPFFKEVLQERVICTSALKTHRGSSLGELKYSMGSNEAA